MNLFILSLAPVIIIAGYVYFRDKYEREPIRLLIFALLAGALTVIPILLGVLMIGIIQVRRSQDSKVFMG